MQKYNKYFIYKEFTRCELNSQISKVKIIVMTSVCLIPSGAGLHVNSLSVLFFFDRF